MNDQDLDIALRKQRLIFRSAALRGQMREDAGAFRPLCDNADKLKEALHWLRHHGQILAGVAVAALVVRPRATLRWTRRGFLAWKAFRTLRDRIAAFQKR